MFKYFTWVLSLALILSAVGSSFSTTASAELIAIPEDQISEEDIAELAAALEFMMEEAAIVDKFGNISGLDLDMIEDEFGSSAELDRLRLELAVPPRDFGFVDPDDAVLDRCLEKKIKNGFGEIITGAVLVTILEFLNQKQYGKAAKKILSIGFKGNLFGITATLAVYMLQCIKKHKGWI